MSTLPAKINVMTNTQEQASEKIVDNDHEAPTISGQATSPTTDDATANDGSSATSSDNAPDPVVWPGNSYPLGSTYDGSGTNFALFSEVADKVELCLIDSDGTETRIEMREVDAHIWHLSLIHI